MIRLILLSLVLSYLSAVEQGQIVRFSDLNRETLQEGVQFIFTDPMTSETVTAEITKILPAGGPIDFTFKPLSTAPHSIDPGPSPSPDVAGVSPRSNGTDMPNPGAPPSLRQALGTGLAAGGFHAVVGTVYQGLIMTNKRTRDLQRSFNERARAEGQQYRAQTDLARAIDFNQTLGHVITARLLSPNIPVNLAALHSAKAMLPVGISTGDARFDGRALPISRRLHSIPSSNVLNRNVKEFGFSALRAGADAYRAGDGITVEAMLTLAQQAADLLVGLDPWTGTLRSGYELFSGSNMITGEALNPFQRTLAGVIFSTSLMSGGLTSSLTSGFELAAKILSRDVSAVTKSRALVDRLKQMGWSEAKVTDFIEFSRNTLGDQIQSVEYAIAAAEDWSLAARSTFPGVLRDLNGSSNELKMIAEELGVGVIELTEKRAMAIGAYNNIPHFQGKAEMIYEHLKGIDFTKPVSLERIEKGTHLMSWTHPLVRNGNYYTKIRTSPARLGIGSIGKLRGEELFAKELREFELLENSRVLRTTAAEIHDSFSIEKHAEVFLDVMKDGTYKTGLQYAPGGATQYLLPAELVRRIR